MYDLMTENNIGIYKHNIEIYFQLHQHSKTTRNVLHANHGLDRFYLIDLKNRKAC